MDFTFRPQIGLKSSSSLSRNFSKEHWTSSGAPSDPHLPISLLIFRVLGVPFFTFSPETEFRGAGLSETRERLPESSQETESFTLSRTRRKSCIDRSDDFQPSTLSQRKLG